MISEKELEEIKLLLDQSQPEFIVEYKTNILSRYGIETSSDISLLSDKRKKLFYCLVDNFHVDFIKNLNEGDIVGIYGWQRGSRDYDGLTRFRQSVFIDNGYNSIFWVKGNYNITDNVNQPEFYDIDVLVTSSSRHLLIPYCVDSFKKLLFTRRKLRWILHDDQVFPDWSSKLLDYAKSEFDEIYTHKPAIGLSRTFDDMIPRIKSKYMIYLQEDWVLEQPINLDRIIWTMDKHTNINLIIFNKYKNMGSVGGFSQTQYDFSGLDLCIYNAWAFLPGIWRVAKFREKWRKNYWTERPEGNFTNSFGDHQKRLNEKYCYNNIGAFLYGKSGEPRIVKHIGDDWRVARWRLENGKPGGNPDSYKAADQYRAPWVPYIETPRYIDIKDKL